MRDVRDFGGYNSRRPGRRRLPGAGHFDTALPDLEKVREKEAQLERQIAEGMTSPPWLEDFVRSGEIAHVD